MITNKKGRELSKKAFSLVLIVYLLTFARLLNRSLPFTSEDVLKEI